MTSDTVVSEPLAADLLEQPRHTGTIGAGTSAVAVVELGQVAGKVDPADVVVRTIDGPLQLREKRLGVVAGDDAPIDVAHVLVLGVVYRLMGEELGSDAPVAEQFVGVNRRVRHVDLRRDGLAERGTRHVRDHSRAGLPRLLVDQREDDGLAVVGRGPLGVASGPRCK